METKETKSYLKMKNLSVNNNPNKIILHHTGGTNADPLADTSHHTAEIVESWHVSGNGWDGIGYTFFIEKNGLIAYGRPMHRTGAHTVGQNSTSIGVCMAGNFDLTTPTKEQERAFIWLCRNIILPAYNIKECFPHRKYATKTCYGKKLKDTYGQELLNEAMKPIVPEIRDGSDECKEFLIKEAGVEKGNILLEIIKLILNLWKKK